jgi:two-component system osmolarity sensor histidine kinase EnvZ
MALTDRLIPPDQDGQPAGFWQRLAVVLTLPLDLIRQLSRQAWEIYWGIWRFIFSRLGLKRYLPRTLFGRALMIIVTPVLLVQGIAAYYFYDRHWDSVTLRLSTGVAGEIALVIEDFYAEPDVISRAELFESTARNLQLIVSYEPLETLPQQEPAGRFEILQGRLTQELRGRLRRPVYVNDDLSPDWVEVRVGLDEGILHVLVPIRRLFTSTSQVFMLWLTGTTVIFFTVAIVFMRNQIRPIRRLARAADRFGKGRDVGDFKLEGAMEVRQAATAFLMMRNRIHRQLTQRTEMLAGVSHDLRTPLTRMKLQLEMMGDSPDIDAMKTDLSDMDQMINGYLAFARGEGSEQTQSTDVGRLIERVCNRARREGLDIELSSSVQIKMPVKPQAIQRCLANLISNAGRHGNKVWVTVEDREATIIITVDDDGPGIPDNRLEDVFKPFFRLDPSRNPTTGGTGLGLTIARDIARNHGGDITLSRSPRAGLRCEIILPE